MDAFKDRLSQRARDTSRPALAHQCRGREITPAEAALAEALMAIYGEGTHDYAAVAEAMMAIYATGAIGAEAIAKGLSERGVTAPMSGRTDWDEALLADELKAINAELDAAYAEQGYGA